MHKDFRKLIREAERQGFRIVRTGKHVIIEAPDGSRYPVPSTPSDWRAIHNAIAWLRRHGLQWPPKR